MRSDLASYQATLDWFAEELALTRGGATVTAPFAGLFASAVSADLVSDAIRIIFCDFDTDPTDSVESNKLIAYLEEIKAGMMRLLQEEEIWMITHPIDRITSL